MPTRKVSCIYSVHSGRRVAADRCLWFQRKGEQWWSWAGRGRTREAIRSSVGLPWDRGRKETRRIRIVLYQTQLLHCLVSFNAVEGLYNAETQLKIFFICCSATWYEYSVYAKTKWRAPLPPYKLLHSSVVLELLHRLQSTTTELRPCILSTSNSCCIPWTRIFGAVVARVSKLNTCSLPSSFLN